MSPANPDLNYEPEHKTMPQRPLQKWIGSSSSDVFNVIWYHFVTARTRRKAKGKTNICCTTLLHPPWLDDKHYFVTATKVYLALAVSISEHSSASAGAGSGASIDLS